MEQGAGRVSARHVVPFRESGAGIPQRWAAEAGTPAGVERVQRRHCSGGWRTGGPTRARHAGRPAAREGRVRCHLFRRVMAAASVSITIVSFIMRTFMMGPYSRTHLAICTGLWGQWAAVWALYGGSGRLVRRRGAVAAGQAVPKCSAPVEAAAGGVQGLGEQVRHPQRTFRGEVSTRRVPAWPSSRLDSGGAGTGMRRWRSTPVTKDSSARATSSSRAPPAASAARVAAEGGGPPPNTARAMLGGG